MADDWKAVGRIKKRRDSQLHMSSDRVITPRYTCDLDELSEFSLGVSLVDGIVGILQELTNKTTVALKSFMEWTPGVTPVIRMCYTRPQISVRREGFMLEYYTWVNNMGVITKPDDTATIAAYDAFQGD